MNISRGILIFSDDISGILVKYQVTMAFRGIRFHNRWNECYVNGSTNAILASERITSEILKRPNHCPSCIFLYNMMNVQSGTTQYSNTLREWALKDNKEFVFGRQNDPAELVHCLIGKCDILKNLPSLNQQ